MSKVGKIGHFWVQNQHFLKFSINLFIRFIWNCTRWQALKISLIWLVLTLKENSYALNRVNGAFLKSCSLDFAEIVANEKCVKKIVLVFWRNSLNTQNEENGSFLEPKSTF